MVTECAVEHAVGSTVWHTFDFSGVLLDGDSINGATAQAVGVTAGTPQPAGDEVSVEVSGGSVGEPAQVTVTVTTALGETLPWTVCFDVVRKRGCC